MGRNLLCFGLKLSWFETFQISWPKTVLFSLKFKGGGGSAVGKQFELASCSKNKLGLYE